MEKRLQPSGCWLRQGRVKAWRAGLFVTGLTLSVASWGQTPPGGKVPVESIEPGVNTSATQPSSSDMSRAAADAPPAGKTANSSTRAGSAPAPEPRKRAVAAASTPAAPGSTAAASAPAATTASGPAAGAPKTGAAGKAHDSIQLDATQITGNRELPKVLYIVPWKRSDLGDLVGKPVNSLLDEVLTPVDRDVFKRQNRYYDALKPDAAKDSAGAASAPPKP